MRIQEFITRNDPIKTGDIFYLELDNSLLIESTVVGFMDDGVIIQGDDTMLAFLKTSPTADRKFTDLEIAIMEGGGDISEAEYQGRNVSLGKPFLTPSGSKKRSVYVKNPKGNVVKVNFGDKKMRIKKSSPNHRKSFRARHHCENPGPRWKARFWSCKAWE